MRSLGDAGSGVERDIEGLEEVGEVRVGVSLRKEVR